MFSFFKVRGLSIGELLKATRAQQAMLELKESSDVTAVASASAGISDTTPVAVSEAGRAAASTKTVTEYNPIESSIQGKEEAGKGYGGSARHSSGVLTDDFGAGDVVDDNDNLRQENNSSNANEGEEEKQTQSMHAPMKESCISSSEAQQQPSFPVLPLASPLTRKMLSRLPPPSEDELDKLARLEKMLQETTRSLPTDSSNLPALTRKQQPRRLHEINLRLGEGETLSE